MSVGGAEAVAAGPGSVGVGGSGVAEASTAVGSGEPVAGGVAPCPRAVGVGGATVAGAAGLHAQSWPASILYLLIYQLCQNITFFLVPFCIQLRLYPSFIRIKINFIIVRIAAGFYFKLPLFFHNSGKFCTGFVCSKYPHAGTASLQWHFKSLIYSFFYFKRCFYYFFLFAFPFYSCFVSGNHSGAYLACACFKGATICMYAQK